MTAPAAPPAPEVAAQNAPHGAPDRTPDSAPDAGSRPGRKLPDLIALLHKRPLLRALLALLSGLSLLPLLYLGGLDGLGGLPFGLLLTGGVFGALVLVPFIEAPQRRLLRALALVAAAALIHWGAVRLTAYLDRHVHGPPAYGAAAVICGVPGLTAALLCALLTVYLAPLRSAVKVIAATSAAGFVGALAFVFPVPFGVSGYIIWQLVVFLALYFTAKTHTAARPAQAP